MSRIAVIVLAAGTSERFGTLDKLATPVAGRSLLAWTLDAAASEGVDVAHRLVVVGPGSTHATRIAEAHGWATVFAHDALRGMGASLRAGLHAAGRDTKVTGVVVVLGDDPLAARLLPQVLADAAAHPDTPVAIRRTPFLPHPVYLPRATWPAPTDPVDDHGLRASLDGSCRWIADPGAHPVDVDLPADVERLAALLR